MNFRQAKGNKIHWLNTGIHHQFSNFLFIDKHYGSNSVLRRIFSLARKQGFQSVLIEEITESESSLLVAENNALRIRRPDFAKAEVHKISFFKSARDCPPAASDFLGYVVFKRDFFSGQANPKAHVYESVMSPFRNAEANNFIHCKKTYDIITTLGTFSVSGVLYAQQNGHTFVCAHVAMRTALASFLPDSDITYEVLNGFAGIDHRKIQLGNGFGLGPPEMECILNGLGISFEKLVHEPSKNLHIPIEYQRVLYGSIESGIPALVGFELENPAINTTGGPRHIIPAFGHTFNEDTWMPQAAREYFGGKTDGYFPSENWLSTFIVHDDNFGPYLCLPRHFLKKDYFRILYGLKFKNTTTTAIEAEAIAFEFFRAIANYAVNNEWFDRFAVFAKGSWLVLRTILINKNDYIAHLEKARSWDQTFLEPGALQKFRDYLPPVFWMIEASAPELFNSSRRKFGELLLPCDQPLPKPLSPSVLLAARLPGVIFIRKSDIEVSHTGLKGHTPLFTF